MTNPKLTFGDNNSIKYAELVGLIGLPVATSHECDCEYCDLEEGYTCAFFKCGRDAAEDKKDSRFVSCPECGKLWKCRFERREAIDFCKRFKEEACKPSKL